MVGRIAFLVVLALATCWQSAQAFADDDSSEPRPIPNLRERLEQFRHDLVGDAPPPRNYANEYQQNNNRTATPQGKAGLPQRGPQPKPAAAAKQNAKSNDLEPIPGAVNSAVRTPSRMEVQSARRAEPSANRNREDDISEPPAQEAQRALPIKKIAEPVKRKRREPEAAESEDDEPRVSRSVPRGGAKKLPATETSEESTDNSAVDTEETSEQIETSEKPERRATPQKKSEKAEKVAAHAGVLFTSQSPALSVEVAGPRRVLIGREAQFVVKIINSGAAANDVIVAVNIPNYAEVTGSQATVGAAQAPPPGEQHDPLQWRINRLEAKSTETLTLRLIPHKSSPLDLAVQWTFTPEASQALVEVQEPKLVMAISGPDEVQYGQSKIYKLIVSNPGNGDTENVMVGLLPIGAGGESLASHRLGTLRAGESKTIDVELTARQAGAITIKAQAFADGGLRSEAAEQVLVRRANLLIEVESPKVKYAGTVGTYHVKVLNAGNATAENVQVAAMLPSEARYVSSSGGGRLDTQQGKIKWTIGTLQAGGERRFEMQCSLATPGENRMQFITMADGDLNAVAMSSTRVEAIADLKLEVRDPQGPIPIGEEAVYEVHIRNRGTKAAEGIDLTVFFSEGLEATNVEGGSHEIAPGQVMFKQIVTLAASEAAVFRVHAKADKSGNHVFRAEVACPSLNTKLATEETTHFYGDDKSAAETASQTEPSSATFQDSAANDPPPERP